jgi:hypothetical protein
MDIPLVAPVLPYMYANPGSSTPTTFAPSPSTPTMVSVNSPPASSFVPVKPSDETDTGVKVVLGLMGLGLLGFGVYMAKKQFDSLAAATKKAATDVSAAAAAQQASAMALGIPPTTGTGKKKHYGGGGAGGGAGGGGAGGGGGTGGGGSGIGPSGAPTKTSSGPLPMVQQAAGALGGLPGFGDLGGLLGELSE